MIGDRTDNCSMEDGTMRKIYSFLFNAWIAVVAAVLVSLLAAVVRS